MKRPSNEVAHMAHKLKDEALRPVTKQVKRSSKKSYRVVGITLGLITIIFALCLDDMISESQYQYYY